MWIMRNDGFVSVVKDWNTADGLVARARRKEDLISLFPDKEVVELDFSDYKYRAFVSKKEYADAIHKRIMEIEYHNFKDSVPDEDLHNFYLGVWKLGTFYED